MAIFQLYYIPLTELTVTNPTDYFGNVVGYTFPNNEIGGSIAHTAYHPGTFTWNGVSKTLYVQDNDLIFDDDNDTDQVLPNNWEGFAAGKIVETQYSYVIQDPQGNQITIYTVNVQGVANDNVYGLVSTKPLLPNVKYTIISNKEYVPVPYADLVCFAAGTAILTPTGERLIETLAVGDLVVTRDHGPQAIRWIGSRTLDALELAKNAALRPVRIGAGALGAGLPEADLLVSPQHRILVRSKIAQRMFGTDEILAAAKQLLTLDGIEIAEDVTEVTYIHMLFDRHEIVVSNGSETESLYTGTEALKAVGPAARAEIMALFPELADDGHITEAARPLARGRQARTLAERHARNGVALVSAT